RPRWQQRRPAPRSRRERLSLQLAAARRPPLSIHLEAADGAGVPAYLLAVPRVKQAHLVKLIRAVEVERVHHADEVLLRYVLQGEERRGYDRADSSRARQACLCDKAAADQAIFDEPLPLGLLLLGLVEQRLGRRGGSRGLV